MQLRVESGGKKNQKETFEGINKTEVVRIVSRIVIDAVKSGEDLKSVSTNENFVAESFGLIISEFTKIGTSLPKDTLFSIMKNILIILNSGNVLLSKYNFKNELQIRKLVSNSIPSDPTPNEETSAKETKAIKPVTDGFSYEKMNERIATIDGGETVSEDVSALATNKSEAHISSNQIMEFISNSYDFESEDFLAKMDGFLSQNLKRVFGEKKAKDVFIQEQRKKVLSDLESVMVDFLSKNKNLISILTGVNEKKLGEFDVTRAAATVMSTFELKFIGGVARDEILVDFLMQDGVSKKQKFLAILMACVNERLQEDKKFRKIRGEFIDSINLDDYGIQEETFKQLESRYISERVKGMESVILQYLYPSKKMDNTPVFLDGSNRRYNNVVSDGTKTFPLTKTLEMMIADLKENEITISVLGDGKKKALDILKKFINRFVVIDTRGA